jgi:hypothetical protein
MGRPSCPVATYRDQIGKNMGVSQVLEERLIEEFGESLRAEAEEKLAEMLADQPLGYASALTEVILGYLEEAGVVAGHELCPHEDQNFSRPCRIIGYYLPDDSSRLELFTSQGINEDAYLPPKAIGKLSGWAARFFDYSVKGDHKRFQDNALTLQAAEFIQKEAYRIEEIHIHVLTNSRVRDKTVADIVVDGRPVSTEIWDLERLYRAAGEDVTREVIDIDLTQLTGQPLPSLEMKPRPTEYETYLTILPGKLIYALFDTYGPRLFEFNVRSFLQAKGAVNRGIQRTIKDEPGRFLAYNNGLTATADEIEVATLHGETVIKRIRGLQIVNGAQTTASIHRAVKLDKLSVDEVAVSMKLTLVPENKLGEFVPLIARFANTQNPIQVADLSASDQFHQQFEILSESVWPPGEESRWFYERARGSYQMARNRLGSTPARRKDFDRTCPRSQHFGKTDLAKYLMTWWGRPQVVSRGAQKNYSAFMFGLRERMGDEWAPDKDFYKETIAQALLFKAAQSVTRKAHLQSYGANVVAYMVAILSARYGASLDFEGLWEMQEVSQEMEALFTLWAPIIHTEIIASAGNRNVTEWCKKDDCWAELHQLQLPLPTSTPPELRAIDSSDRSSGDLRPVNDDEVTPIYECTAVGAASWANVMAWATSTADIEPFDKKVAHTLSGYAMDGWVKQPSLKQAVRGARVLAAARAAGVLSG